MRKQAGKRPERKKPARLISKAHLLERNERQLAFDAAQIVVKKTAKKTAKQGQVKVVVQTAILGEGLRSPGPVIS